MKFTVRRYFSGFCSYVVEAPDEETAYENAKNLPPKEDEILNTLEEWKECDEVIPEENG